ncbi:hypothetical protein F7725_020353 [Dissostichus mawsoni]|uniref:DDE Tnp4 domain-containing protein n=1 Tax=Dissostichus mawsoni TaxID=36200 RepID=A0A7J5YD18_DISMA|nr:hypothetical protein F7725_020353 [Dissostichus mawsoni]
MRKAILLHLEVQHPHSPYKRLNSSVPALELYFGDGCLLRDFRISRDSLEALMRCLGPERRQAWGHHMTVLTTVYWLAHGTPLHGPHVLQGVEDIAALRQSVIWLPAGPEQEEVRQGFQQLANSPAFSSCVGAIDGCHIRIKTQPGPSGQDYVNRKLFPSIQLQAVCDGKGTFLQTFVGFPGSVHDTRVLKNSAIYKEALYPPPGYFIVGDGGSEVDRAGETDWQTKSRLLTTTRSSKSWRNFAEASSVAACWRLKRSSSLTASAPRNCNNTVFLFLRGGGPAEVDGSTYSWLSEPDSVASSSSTVAWLWTASVDVEPLPEPTAAVAESIRVGGSMDGLHRWPHAWPLSHFLPICVGVTEPHKPRAFRISLSDTRDVSSWSAINKVCSNRCHLSKLSIFKLTGSADNIKIPIVTTNT